MKTHLASQRSRPPLASGWTCTVAFHNDASSFEGKNLLRMVQFAQVVPDPPIVATIELERHKGGILVAEYWTELPTQANLEQKLHHAVPEAKERLSARQLTLDGTAPAPL